MKKYLLILLIGFGGCKEQAIEVVESKGNVNVELLFEIDGCKVYRFYDGGYKYFSNCNGVTSWDETRTTGKTTQTEHFQIPNSSSK